MVLTFHKHLLYFLITMIAFQSVDVISDTVNFYQPNAEYTKASYFSNLPIELDKNTPSSASAEHCYYCHGSMSLPPLGILLHHNSIISEKEIADCGMTYTSQRITPDLRPPIV